MLNPYATHLGKHDPVPVITATPAKLQTLVEKIGAAAAEKPRAPGKWSAREIVCHLADCEFAFGFRLRQTLAEDRHVMQPFDQGRWADRYACYTLQSALATFSALRQWNLALVRFFTAADLARQVNHPERGEMTLATILETMGGHDINHLNQLEEIAG